MSDSPTLSEYLQVVKEKTDLPLPIYSVTLRDGMQRRESLGRSVLSELEGKDNLFAAKGDICYNMMRMWQGASGLAPEDCHVSPAYVVCRPRQNLDPVYASYLLKSEEAIKEFIDRSQGVTSDRWRLYPDAFLKISLFIPPLPEQKKIADILSGIDTMITKHNRKMISLGHLQASLIENITLGTKEAGSRQATDIGECPADWTATKLGDIADFANGNSFKSEDWGESGYPIIRIQNLNGGSEFNYFLGRIEEKWFVPHGSLLFAWSGQRGKSFGPFIWEGRDGVLNQHIFKVTHAKDIDRQYLFLLLKMVQLKAERDAHGFKDSFMHVKKSDIVSTSIAVPSLAVQKRLANSYAQLTLQISLEEKKMKFLKNIKNACSADLLTGRKRVSV